ncbi:MAG: ABC transporter substrate-binding protein [Alphaproteobacteria bacterium]|nr:ABC transporter substrate-binding protein [Alphaproteobacteria bacterium]
MRLPMLTAVIFFAVVCAGVSARGEDTTRAALSEFTFFTENYPPLNYEENAELKGLSVDLLLEMLARSNVPVSPTTIVVVPWARGYQETQNRPGTVLFSTVRTPAREKLFKWVGPIGRSNIVLVSRLSSNITIRGAEDFPRFTYAVVQHDRGEQALFEAGLGRSSMVHTNSSMFAAHLLARGRVDLWAYEKIVYLWALGKLGYNTADFEVVHAFEDAHYYFAFNPQTDDAIISLMQAALEGIRADGTLAAITRQHLPEMADDFLPE